MNVSDFYNRHLNECCFIYGSGSSLKDIDINPIRKYLSISINEGILKAPFSKYFVSDDPSIDRWDYYYTLLKNKNIIKFFYKDRFEKNIENFDEDVVFYKHKWWYSPENKRYNLEGVKLTKEEPIIGAANSAGSAVHLAYIMGCKTVFLMGFDCCFIDGKKYFWQFLPEKFHPKNVKETQRTSSKNINVSKKGKDVNNTFNFFIKYWTDFVEVNKTIINSSFNIIDCSRGLLNCFQKKDIKEVIDGLSI